MVTRRVGRGVGVESLVAVLVRRGFLGLQHFIVMFCNIGVWGRARELFGGGGSCFFWR
jgi:hypothetical protein